MTDILYSLNIKCTKAFKKQIQWAFTGHGQRLLSHTNTKNQSFYTCIKKKKQSVNMKCFPPHRFLC